MSDIKNGEKDFDKFDFLDEGYPLDSKNPFSVGHYDFSALRDYYKRVHLPHGTALTEEEIQQFRID